MAGRHLGLEPGTGARVGIQAGRGATTVVSSDYHAIVLPVLRRTTCCHRRSPAWPTPRSSLWSLSSTPAPSVTTLRFRIFDDTGTKRTTSLDVDWFAIGY